MRLLVVAALLAMAGCAAVEPAPTAQRVVAHAVAQHWSASSEITIFVATDGADRAAPLPLGSVRNVTVEVEWADGREERYAFPEASTGPEKLAGNVTIPATGFHKLDVRADVQLEDGRAFIPAEWQTNVSRRHIAIVDLTPTPSADGQLVRITLLERIDGRRGPVEYGAGDPASATVRSLAEDATIERFEAEVRTGEDWVPGCEVRHLGDSFGCEWRGARATDARFDFVVQLKDGATLHDEDFDVVRG